jgi:hypothetical protein
VDVQGGSKVDLRIYPQRKYSFISVLPRHENDVQGVALVQALLSRGLPRMFHDAGQEVEIVISGFWFPGSSPQAGFKALIAPLLPFVARCGRRIGPRFMDGDLLLCPPSCLSFHSLKTKLHHRRWWCIKD